MKRIPWMIGAGVGVLVAVGGLLVWHAESKVSKTALADKPKPVTVVSAEAATFRDRRSYIGTLEPWISANVGPQFISAYVDTVLVRPGAQVKRGAVLATLDCRNASAASRAVAMRARAVEEREKATSAEAARLEQLKAGNFVSENEVQQKSAASLAARAELASVEASLAKSALEVSDCVLRAPFDGEVSVRNSDPGAFLRPGDFIVSVVDRGIIRFTAFAPEVDFDAVAPDTPVRLRSIAIDQTFPGKVSRRSPSADLATRTVHFEVDLPDTEHKIPVGTTAECSIEVGEPVSATKIPLAAANIRNNKAIVYVITDGVAHQRSVEVLGESGGDLFVKPDIAAGAQIVSEGRALLNDGDHVIAKAAHT